MGIQSKNAQPEVTYEKESLQKGTDLINNSWGYMPGVTTEEDGLSVSPMDFTIVDQDGKIAQKNPSINLAGAHLEKVRGDFTIHTDIDLQNSTAAIVQFYGNVPIVADEFRIERESLQVAVTKNKLIVKVWNAKGNDPAEVYDFGYDKAETYNVSISRFGKMLVFAVNGKNVGAIDDPGVFTSGTIWFGLDAQNDTWKLTHLAVEKIGNGNFIVADGSTVTVKESNTKGLRELIHAKRGDFIIGSAMAIGPLTTDTAYAQVALSQFSSFTPENEMKMINLQPKRGVYAFEKADAMVYIAKQNGLSVHGHTLVFGEANPAWFTALPAKTEQDKQVIRSVMKDHIQTVVTHFGDAVDSWDVINEPLADYDEFENGQLFRNHKWYQAMGESYILTALEAAHNANPDARLFINEYGLESDDDRWEAMLGILTRLKPQLEERGIPVEQVGVGFQSHIYEREDRVDPEVLKTHFRQLESLGYIAQVSELDVYSGDGDKVQSDQYVNVLKACLEEKNCIAWRVWILSDKYNFWKNDDGLVLNGKDGLYDTAMKPRPAMNALLRFLK